MQDFQKILEEANKCLNCQNPMCKRNCPIETRIPEFINEIKNENLNKAYEILQENNIMSDVCSNVCPFEEYCIGNCVRGIKGEPVNVSKLEKYVNIWARDNNINYTYKIEKPNGHRVAIIGSGPAGLECAVELAKKGYEVTIFEKEQEIGGLLSYGIPGFRLPRNITKNLTKRVKELGIKVNVNCELGKDITINRLKELGYDAIFVAIGREIPSSYKLCDEECSNIYKASYILKEYNAKRIVENLGNVIIIGGGNVATDSARAAIRMGATSSTIIYRRDRNSMPARDDELEAAFNDGVDIIYNTKVTEAILENGRLTKIKCSDTKLNNGKLEDVEDSEHYINANSVIFAIGQKPDKELLEKENIELDEKGYVKTNDKGVTNIDGVFAGGDVAQEKATVCVAIANGRKVANEINEYIKNKCN